MRLAVTVLLRSVSAAVMMLLLLPLLLLLLLFLIATATKWPSHESSIEGGGIWISYELRSFWRDYPLLLNPKNPKPLNPSP